MDSINGISYFNGTSCPIVFHGFIDYKKHAHDQMMEALKNGITLDQLKVIHYDQMVLLEKTLTDICGGPNGLSTDENIMKWVDKMDIPGINKMEIINLLWYTNVYILLKLKVIDNDNNNGMMFTTHIK